MKLLSCKEASQLASQRLDRRLGFAERVTLRVHLAICRGCRSVADEMAFLRKAVAQLAERAGGP